MLGAPRETDGTEAQSSSYPDILPQNTHSQVTGKAWALGLSGAQRNSWPHRNGYGSEPPSWPDSTAVHTAS